MNEDFFWRDSLKQTETATMQRRTGVELENMNSDKTEFTFLE